MDRPTAEAGYIEIRDAATQDVSSTNWAQTTPGKGWNSLLRLYAPLQPWFDKSWKPGDFELVE